MGHKVNPLSFRLGNGCTWNSRWFASSKNYQNFLLEDEKLRKAISKQLKTCGVSKIEIGRSINKIDIIIHVSKPGMVIGRGGEGIENLKKFVNKILKIKEGDKNKKIDLKIEGIKDPNLDAHLVAQNIADALAKRMPFKRIMFQSIERTMQSGAKGVKVMLAGRVGGAEIHRTVKEIAGTIPLSTIRAKIDYASVPSLTRSGYVGVKVWVHLP
jgi:small subunit ribosomal protein S3